MYIYMVSPYQLRTQILCTTWAYTYVSTHIYIYIYKVTNILVHLLMISWIKNRLVSLIYEHENIKRLWIASLCSLPCVDRTYNTFIPAEARNLPLLQNVQTGSGSHSTSYLVGIRVV